MSARPVKKVHSPSQFSADSIIARKVAVELVARRLQKLGERARHAENRVSHRISYDVKRGRLCVAAGGQFVFGDLIRWAEGKWPGSFSDLLAAPNVATGNLTAPLFSISGRCICLPSSLEQCHAELVRLDLELEAARREIQSLRPDAEKWRAHKEQLRINGSKAKRGRK